MVNFKCKKKAKYVKETGPRDNDEVEALKEEHFNVHRRLYNQTEFLRTYPSKQYEGFNFFEFMKKSYGKSCTPSKECAKRTLYNRVPAVKYIKNYKRDFILPDLLAGITVGIMHIPQGMAYSLLATLPPIYGLYTSFYPVLIYWIFGTSKQISIGTFAVISLMVASTIADLEPKYVPPVGFNASLNTTDPNLVANYLSLDRNQARVMIAMANCFWVGVIQLAMSIGQLGVITNYLSEPMVNSFLAGCAVHVMTSQIKFLLGLKGLKAYVGIGKIPLTYINIFSNLNKTNIASLIISIVSITVLSVVKIHINERFAKKMPAPFPIELIIVVFGTVISYLSNFSTRWKVDVIGPIPAGLPGPIVPPLFIIKDMITQSILTAVIAFAINFSLADLFSKTHRYKININQELFAYGATNIFSGFFPCFTTGASLARSCVQNNAGGRTQVVSLWSCLIIGITLLVIAPLFKELPQACLASIIVVALKTLFLALTKLPFYWKVNKIEFFHFCLTFLSTTFMDVDYGLFIGVGFYVVMNVIRSSQPYHTLLGNIPGTELYKDIKLYKDAHQIHNIRIVRVQQELHATSSFAFKKSIYELTAVKPQDYLHIKTKIEDYKKRLEKSKNNKNSRMLKWSPGFLKPLAEKMVDKMYAVPAKPTKIFIIDPPYMQQDFSESVSTEKKIDLQNVISGLDNVNYLTEYEKDEYEAETRAAETESQIDIEENHKNHQVAIDYDDQMNEREDLSTDDEDESMLEMPRTPFKCLIIDCAPINFIDTVGVKTLKQLISDYNEIGIRVYLAECNDAFKFRVDSMESAGRESLLDSDIIHLSIHDAVLHAQKMFRKTIRSKYKTKNKMLDLFTIFSKGGIVLWYFQGTSQLFTNSVNELIKSVILQERGVTSAWNHNTLSLQYKLDNEFELVFVVAYQNILKLTYVDKFLTEIQLRFRDKYKQSIESGEFDRDFNDFRPDFDKILRECETEAKNAMESVQKPRSYKESEKSTKTVASMIETKKSGGLFSSFMSVSETASGGVLVDSPPATPPKPVPPASPKSNGEETDSPESKIKKLIATGGGKPKKFEPKKKTPASPQQQPVKKGKKLTTWENEVSGPLDYGEKVPLNGNGQASLAEQNDLEKYASLNDVGKGKYLKDIEVVDSPLDQYEHEHEEEEEEETEVSDTKQSKKSTPKQNGPGQSKVTNIKKPSQTVTKSGTGGLFSSLKSLVGSKTLTKESIEPVMEKLQDHLIAKNVAAEIAQKVCSNVAQNLEGKQLSSFQFVTTTVKQALQDSMVQILTPKKRVDILRDVYESQRQRKPYVIVFCGVNGVGKSTNLAKVTFWLIENSFRVLIAACDTFRSGAVEQLRTHTRHLNNLHPPENHDGKTMVELFEKGYGKDAAAIAHDAIGYAKDNRIDVVLVDTAGRMQDNEPLMKALAKLININNPDLVLFVGEALVGNEAVDQVRKFNQALIDNSTIMTSNIDQARTIDGIILTKFDTIDDKVGAAISMTYTTGQPIVFVGTGQTYSDLKSLNAQSVVQSLLK